MSAPPDNRVPTPGQNSMGNMMGGNNPPPTPHQEQHQNDHASQSTVRHIPIFVEGRDEPIINKAHPDPATNFAEHKPAYAPPPPEREQYFERDPTMGFHHPPNFSRAFGTPFNKGFRQAPQPYAQQKVFTQPQNSPPQGRSQSPKPQNQHYTQVPVHHQQTHPPQQAPQQPQRQHSPQPQRQHSPQPQRQHSPKPQRQHSPQPQHAAAPSQQAPPPQQAPPQQAPPTQQAPSANDPITKILSIQKDVLDLMTEVENFVGVKSDKRYIYLDEMLTRNLIKLDDIETEGKENIRLARKEAIKCIQKCIAVLEAKAEGKIPTTPQPSAVVSEPELNGVSEQPEQPAEQTQGETKEEVSVEKEPADPEASTEETKDQEAAKGTPKKTKKVVKKRDKSKDKDGANGDKDMKKEEKSSDNVNMQMDEKGDTQAVPAQPMDTESSAASSQ